MDSNDSRPPPTGGASGRPADGKPLQAVIFVPPLRAEVLFGRLGTHSVVAGAVLQLCGHLETTRLGRRVLVKAPSRPVAASAIGALLFQLRHALDASTQLADSRWSYYLDSGEKCKWFKFGKIVESARDARQKGEPLLSEGHLMQDKHTQCWVPFWYLMHEADRADGAAAVHAGAYGAAAAPGGAGRAGDADVLMEDAEELVKELNSQRQQGGLLQAPERQAPLEDFPELTEAGAEPMEYELTQAVGVALAAEDVRVYVVVDTNVLMSHLAVVERVFDGFAGAVLEARKAGRPAVEVVLVVPWVVLCELDKLKGSKRGGVGKAALHALARLRALTTERDTYVRAQPAAEHTRAVSEVRLPDNGPELRNDDRILQTAKLYETFAKELAEAGQAAGVFLLSNDTGLILRAKAEGVQCFTARELPRDPLELAQRVPAVDPGALQQQGNPQGRHPGLLPSSSQSSMELPHSPGGTNELHAGARGSSAQSPAVPQLHQQQQQRSAGGLAGSAAASLAAPPAQLHEQRQHSLDAQQQQALAQALQAQHAQQTQDVERARQLAEQMQQLQMQARLAQHAQQLQAQAQLPSPHQQQHVQHPQPLPAHEQQQQQQQQQQALLAALQQQDAVLGQVAHAAGMTFEQLLAVVARLAQMPASRVLVERDLLVRVGAPASPQLARALQTMQNFAANPEQAVPLLAQLREQEAASQQAQAAAVALQAAVQQQQQQHAAAAAHEALSQQQQQQQQRAQAAEVQAGAPQQQLAAALRQLQASAAHGPAATAAMLALQQELVQGQVAAAASAELGTHAMARQLSAGGSARRGGSGELPAPGMPVGAAHLHPAQRPAQPDAAAAALLAARQLEAQGITPAHLLAELSLVVTDDICPIIMHHYQQDQGDVWDDMLPDDEQPPWDAPTVLKFPINHNSVFVFGGSSARLTEDWKGRLQRMRNCMLAQHRRRGGPELHAVAELAWEAHALLQQLTASARLPLKDNKPCPDPGDIAMYVPLEEAEAALQRGLQRCAALLRQLGVMGHAAAPQPAAHPAQRGLGGPASSRQPAARFA